MSPQEVFVSHPTLPGSPQSVDGLSVRPDDLWTGPPSP